MLIVLTAEQLQALRKRLGWFKAGVGERAVVSLGTKPEVGVLTLAASAAYGDARSCAADIGVEYAAGADRVLLSEAAALCDKAGGALGALNPAPEMPLVLLTLAEHKSWCCLTSCIEKWTADDAE